MLLVNLLAECRRCQKVFDQNAAILVAEDGAALTDEQVEAVFVELHGLHQEHV